MPTKVQRKTKVQREPVMRTLKGTKPRAAKTDGSSQKVKDSTEKTPRAPRASRGVLVSRSLTPWPARPAGSWASLTPPPTTQTITVSNTAQLVAAINHDSVKVKCNAGTYTNVSITISKTNVVIIGEGVTFKGGTSPIINARGSHIWIEGIKFDGSRCHAIDVGGKDVNVVNCSCTRAIGYFVNVGASAVGVRVVKCSAPDGVSDNFFYTGAGSQYVELESCTNPKGSVAEHCFRLHSDHARVIDNTFSMNLRTDNVMKGFQSRLGRDHYIGYNRLSGTLSQVSIGPLAANTTKWLDDVVFEHNTCTGLGQFQLFPAVRNLSIRDNTINKKNNSGTVIGTSPSDDPNRPGPAGQIKNNTSTGTKFYGGDGSNMQWKNLGNKLNGVPVT